MNAKQRRTHERFLDRFCAEMRYRPVYLRGLSPKQQRAWIRGAMADRDRRVQALLRSRQEWEAANPGKSFEEAWPVRTGDQAAQAILAWDFTQTEIWVSPTLLPSAHFSFVDPPVAP